MFFIDFPLNSSQFQRKLEKHPCVSTFFAAKQKVLDVRRRSADTSAASPSICAATKSCRSPSWAPPPRRAPSLGPRRSPVAAASAWKSRSLGAEIRSLGSWDDLDFGTAGKCVIIIKKVRMIWISEQLVRC